MLDSEVSWKVLLISISTGLRLLLWLGVPRNSVLHGADVSLHCAALHFAVTAEAQCDTNRT